MTSALGLFLAVARMVPCMVLNAMGGAAGGWGRRCVIEKTPCVGAVDAAAAAAADADDDDDAVVVVDDVVDADVVVDDDDVVLDADDVVDGVDDAGVGVPPPLSLPLTLLSLSPPPCRLSPPRPPPAARPWLAPFSGAAVLEGRTFSGIRRAGQEVSQPPGRVVQVGGGGWR